MLREDPPDVEVCPHCFLSLSGPTHEACAEPSDLLEEEAYVDAEDPLSDDTDSEDEGASVSAPTHPQTQAGVADIQRVERNFFSMLLGFLACYAGIGFFGAFVTWAMWLLIYLSEVSIGVSTYFLVWWRTREKFQHLQAFRSSLTQARISAEKRIKGEAALSWNLINERARFVTAEMMLHPQYIAMLVLCISTVIFVVRRRGKDFLDTQSSETSDDIPDIL